MCLQVIVVLSRVTVGFDSGCGSKRSSFNKSLMRSATSTKPEPLFLEGSLGRLFAIHHPPQTRDVKGCMLYVQPLGEEMNRCRQMASLQAQQFAQLGYGTLLLDLYGTGDSEGEYREGTWDGWKADLRAGLSWLTSRNYPEIMLWGVRHGALLALELAREMPPPRRLLLWQPTVSGQAALTQVLRIQMAGNIADQSNESKEGTKALRDRLAAGETVELSGYETSGALAGGLDRARIADCFDLTEMHVTWFDVLASQGQEASRGSTKTKAEWEEAGATLRYETVVGPAFWQVWERVVASDLIARTSASLAAR